MPFSMTPASASWDEQQQQQQQPTSPATGRIRRSYIACQRCHRKKTKCDGELPCRSCRRSNNASGCLYPTRERKVTVLESYLKRLQAENKQLREGRPSNAGSTLAPAAPSNLLSPVDQSPEGQDEAIEEGPGEGGDEGVKPVDVANPLLEDRIFNGQDADLDTGDIPSSSSTSSSYSQPVYVGGAACTAFANRLRQHIRGAKNPAGCPRLIRVYKHPSLQRTIECEYNLPRRAYAIMLVQVVLRFVGSDYHFVRRRSFVERLHQVYDGHAGAASRVFLCRLLVVFALGELYLKKPNLSGAVRSVPGTDFFLQATCLFQELYEEADVDYIETLLLMSFYSHALNRKNSAYTYAGLALRLSMTLGLHRNITYNPKISPVEIENRRRVWWTVYTFDRLCSSKLGHPVMLRDEDIDAPLPSSEGLSPDDREEFVDAGQLNANTKLARITGYILDLIYGIPTPQETEFVKNVHKILTSLKSWDASLPETLKLNHEKTPPYTTRSVASLRLHFNQCIILTTRPVLLYVFKYHIKSASGATATATATSPPSSSSPATPLTPPKPLSPMTIALSEACIYAARASARLLGQLWIGGDVATFGYFDAHYIFSCTVVLMVSGALRANEADRDSVALARSLIRSMADDGNLPAREFCDRLASLQRDFDDCLGRLPTGGGAGAGTGGENSDGTENGEGWGGPLKGYVTAAGTFAAHVGPAPGDRPARRTSAAYSPRPGRMIDADGIPATTPTILSHAVSNHPLPPPPPPPPPLPPYYYPGNATLLDGHGALEDPFIRDFLGQPNSQWSPGAATAEAAAEEEAANGGTWSLAWDSGSFLRSYGDLA